MNLASVARRSVAVAGVIAVIGLSGGMAAAGPVPYSDPAVTGSIGLCNKSGQPVTSGSITDRPFVWRAVSSVAAPHDYTGSGRKATLLAYQPRPGVAADQWSGDQLTATSSYSNSESPMSQATPVDFTLQDFLGEFKPMVNGLLQLRIYFGIPGRPTWNSSYPATDIQITGKTWHVVRGGSVPCSNGTSTSSEYDNTALNPVPSMVPTAPTSAPNGGSSLKSSPAVPSKKPTSAKAAPASPIASVGTAFTSSSHVGSKSGSDLWKVAVPVLAVGAVAAAGVLWQRRRSGS